MWQAAGVSLPAKGPPAAVTRAAECGHQVAAPIHYFQWRPSPGQGEVNSIEI